MSLRYAALILAAGASSRMRAGFKPLLPIPCADGRRDALECLTLLYREFGAEPVAVVSGERGEETAARARRLDILHVPNPRPEEGMFSSVRAGLAALASSGAHCFVHPADIPLVRFFTLAALSAQAEKEPETAYIPAFAGEEGHPPLLPAAHFPSLLSGRKQGGLRAALRELPHSLVPVADANILLDMDDDGDYAEVCRRAPRRAFLEPEEARELLRGRGIGARGMAHAEAVARAAESFALALNASGCGYALDPLLARAGGLLHDMCKGQAEHERAAGESLRAMRLPLAARLVEEHRDCRLAAGASFTEKDLVCLADKYMCGDRPVSLEERFGPKLAQFRQDAAARRAVRGRLARARAAERRFFQESGARAFDLARSAAE
jgi:CTP:molybdopterin cytidylyltransferase MocA